VSADACLPADWVGRDACANRVDDRPHTAFVAWGCPISCVAWFGSQGATERRTEAVAMVAGRACCHRMLGRRALRSVCIIEERRLPDPVRIRERECGRYGARPAPDDLGRTAVEVCLDPRSHSTPPAWSWRCGGFCRSGRRLGRGLRQSGDENLDHRWSVLDW